MKFECPKCGGPTTLILEDGKFEFPEKCGSPGCYIRGTSLKPDRMTALTVDSQRIKIQELDEKSAEGRIPRTVEVELTGDLVEACIPGDIVNVCGVVKSVNAEVQAGRTGKRARENTLFLLYINANSVR
jgi:DNA helicase MCM8